MELTVTLVTCAPVAARCWQYVPSVNRSRDPPYRPFLSIASPGRERLQNRRSRFPICFILRPPCILVAYNFHSIRFYCCELLAGGFDAVCVPFSLFLGGSRRSARPLPGHPCLVKKTWKPFCSDGFRSSEERIFEDTQASTPRTTLNLRRRHARRK